MTLTFFFNETATIEIDTYGHTLSLNDARPICVQALAGELGHDDAQVIRLTGVYHNLLRRWPEQRGGQAGAAALAERHPIERKVAQLVEAEAFDEIGRAHV